MDKVDILTICKYGYDKMKKDKCNEIDITISKKQLEYIICSLEGQYAFDSKLDEFLGLKEK